LVLFHILSLLPHAGDEINLNPPTAPAAAGGGWRLEGDVA